MSTQMGDESTSSQPRYRSEQDTTIFEQSGGTGAPMASEGSSEPQVEREQEIFGGLQWGSAFFGWITATGMVVFASAILAGIGALVQQAPNIDLSRIAENPQSAGWVGGGVLVAVILFAYFCGGYVAGRMARFDGGKQGLAVWLWAILMAAVVTAVGLSLGQRLDVTEQLSGLPTIPIEEGDRSLAAVVAVVVVLVTALVGALLGGFAGMRFHRKVDAASGRDRL
ncbi:MAG: hypothetical protein WBG57_10085 [Ornithinimicrobium sp.]